MLDYIKLTQYARRDTTLIPNHRLHVLPKVKRRIAELQSLLVLLARAKCDDPDLVNAFRSELQTLLESEEFYETAVVLPNARPRYSDNYRAYAKAHGRTPESQLEHDHKTWPGGCNCGFILWIGQMQRLFLEKNPDLPCSLGDEVRAKLWIRFLFRSGVPLDNPKNPTA